MEMWNELFGPLVEDGRVGSRHISTFLALLQLRERHGGPGPFFIKRGEIMRMGKLKGEGTYYRVMRELDEWGYIEYWPSNRKEGRSKVFLVG